MGCGAFAWDRRAAAFHFSVGAKSFIALFRSHRVGSSSSSLKNIWLVPPLKSHRHIRRRRNSNRAQDVLRRYLRLLQRLDLLLPITPPVPSLLALLGIEPLPLTARPERLPAELTL